MTVIDACMAQQGVQPNLLFHVISKFVPKLEDLMSTQMVLEQSD